METHSATAPYAPLPQVFISIVDNLGIFPVYAPNIPHARIPILRIIRALMVTPRSPDGLVHRKLGKTVTAINAPHETVACIVTAIQNTCDVKHRLFRWATGFFDNLFVPVRRTAHSAGSTSSTPSPGARDLNFRERLFARDGPACLLTETIDLLANDRDIETWEIRHAVEEDPVSQGTLEGAHIIPLPIADNRPMA